MVTKHPPDRIGDLPRLGRPATGALLEHGITTLAQVAQWRERDLLALHGVGPRAVGMLGEALREAGLGFRA